MLDTGNTAGCRARAIALCAAVFVALLSLPIAACHANAQTSGDRYAAFVQEVSTGKVLLAVNADEPRYPASLTKMMTLYLIFEALERGSITDRTLIRVSRHAAGMAPSKLGLRAGSAIRVREAVMALITKSANDAAAALGEHLAGGSEVAFARMMTRKARALGMSRTTFRNASGLPHPKQVTTARDMAVLSQRLIQDFPERYAYFSATGFNWKGRHHRNHNRLLADYDGADGIKTGYIRASGFNLAASAMRDGRRLVAVVFGGASGQERDQQVMALLDRGFDKLEPGTPGEMMVAGRAGKLRLVGTANATSLAPAMRSVGDPEVADRRRKSSAAAPGRPAVRGNWAIQVGAFSAREPAQDAARRAARQGGKAEVRRVRVKDRWFWRARVTGLSAAEARRTCNAARDPCMVLSSAQQ